MDVRICAAVAVLLITAACGGQNQSKPQSTRTAPASIASGEPVPAKLDVAPGRVGRVTIGMTSADAAATGFFDTDVKIGGLCAQTMPLQWKEPYLDQVDVLMSKDTIASMGIRRGLRTDKGVGIGSTLAEVEDAYGDALSPPAGVGYVQTGVFVSSGVDWLGFLIDADPSDVTPKSTITFMEVTRDIKPELMRDGC